jgi:hypothetical protein
MLVARSKAEQNQAAIDPWTVVHFGTGLALGLLNAPASAAAALGVGYEIAEQAFEDSDFGQRFFNISGPETFPNVVVDLAVYGLGWWLGQAWNRTG